MLSVLPDGTSYLPVFFGFAGALLVLAVFAILWRQLWLGVMALSARTAYRAGLYRPEPTKRTAPERRDGAFLAFSKVLRTVCRFLPGDPNRHPHTYIISLVAVGIPMFVLVLALLWGVPLFLFGYVLDATSSGWALVLAALSVVVYLGALLTALKALARTVPKLKRVRKALV